MVKTTFSHKIDPCVAKITQRTGCSALYLVTCDKVTDQYWPCSFASPRLEAAIAVPVQAQSTGTGNALQLAGLLYQREQCQHHEKVNPGYGIAKTLRSSCGVPYNQLPSMMEWVNYNKWAIHYGVKLHGFPGGVIKSPTTISTVPLLAEVKAALREGQCFWCKLEPDKWEAQKAAGDSVGLDATGIDSTAPTGPPIDGHALDYQPSGQLELGFVTSEAFSAKAPPAKSGSWLHIV
ncbi:hypothetical protein CONPUDRAFT_77047 [Coniophora puteana RWD-64-598 SS2]|uniref:Uncharacterized protein n=1 Tax=Coniophora puteana (strain RWD-64-598) TaxID=741705 RepID=A0A5M3MBM5_CONPW|nr:uncharacterized protein CONPUDRAFT_77047 [Coniophora puteana RWD-64-598 SS2]EIW76031.1 hypothetical protein CONPUDRAFT_77047 [Coniophora puteana RWD-64-598 SS2]